MLPARHALWTARKENRCEHKVPYHTQIDHCGSRVLAPRRNRSDTAHAFRSLLSIYRHLPVVASVESADIFQAGRPIPGAAALQPEQLERQRSAGGVGRPPGETRPAEAVWHGGVKLLLLAVEAGIREE
jgi:hypothetical protein